MLATSMDSFRLLLPLPPCSLLHIFEILLIGHLFLFGEMFIRSFALLKSRLFIFSLLSCKHFIYVLGRSPYSDILLENIFSHSVTCIFIFLMVLFTAEMFFTCYSSIYFFFVACAFCVISKKLLPNTRSWRFAPIFSSSCFIVLALKSNSIIHFELIVL